MQSLEDFRIALAQGADDDALDRAAEDVRRDGGARALAEALRLRIDHERDNGRVPLELTGLRFRLASTLEEVARGAPGAEASEAALEAAALQRDVLNDGEATSRCLVLALRAGANDGALLKRAVDAVGDLGNAQHLVERALKRKETKADAALSASLRRTAQRLCEMKGDVHGAFFEAMKAARKQPGEGLYIDEVFRLALEARRDTEASAFFAGLADDASLPPRLRASLYNKLGATLERMQDKASALRAFESSLALRDSKAARNSAAGLKAALSAPAEDAAASSAPVPPEMREDVFAVDAAAIHANEPPDVTPSYPPNRTFRSMHAETELESTHSSRSAVQPARAVPSLEQFPPIPADAEDDDVEATDLVVSSELTPTAVAGSAPAPPLPVPGDGVWGARGHAPVLAPADVTLPRYDANFLTASLGDMLPPPPAQTEPTAVSAVPSEAAAPRALPSLALPSVEESVLHEVPSFLAPPTGAPPEVPLLADEARAPEDALPPEEALPTRAAPSTAQEPTRRTITAGLRTAAAPASLVDVVSAPAPVSAPPLPEGAAPVRAALVADALPPLPMPPSTAHTPDERPDPVARALKALEDGETHSCVAAALALEEHSPRDARVLRLAARALLNEAPGGALPPEAVELFIRHADRNGDRAAQIALDVLRRLPGERVVAYEALWLAGARAAGLDAPRVLELLRARAIDDAPDGPVFRHVEHVLAETKEHDERDALLQAAYARATRDQARAALVRKRVALFELRGRIAETLPLWAELATQLEPRDAEVRRAARALHAERATPDERARLLTRLAAQLEGADALDVEHELLDVRLSVDDDVGAEATARAILAREPADARAAEAVIALLERDPARIDELTEALRHAAASAAATEGRAGEARALLTRLATTLDRAGRSEDAAEAWAQLARFAPTAASVQAALEKLDAARRHKEAVGLLEEVAAGTREDRWRAELLVRAAEITRTQLMKRGRACELLERALLVDADHVGALALLAEILVETGDGPGAVAALERVAVATPDVRARAHIEMRIARLLDELVLKPDAAILRYRAAVAADPMLKEAWEALRTLGRQRGDRSLVVEALTALCALEPPGRARAALWRQIAKVERDERGDLVAATAALRHALDEEPADLEALALLVELLAHRAAPELDVDAVLEQPPAVLLDSVRAALVRAAALTALPPPLWRLDAAARAHASDMVGAVTRLEALLKEQPDDLRALLQLARIHAVRGAGADDQRLRVLEQLLLHHAYSLKPLQQVEVWGDLTALRAAAGDHAGAKKAAKKVMALAATEELRRSLSDRAVRAVALALDDQRDVERDPRQVIAALRLDAARTLADAERARLLERAADVAVRELADTVLSRQLLEEAVRADPRSVSARDGLFELEMAGGDINGVLAQMKELATRETDARKRGALYLRRFRLMKKHGFDPQLMEREVVLAVESDASSQEILDAAAAWFHERNDVDGLDRLYTAQLRGLPRDDVRGRIQILERLAQLRRYERRDLAGAVEALEAIIALDPDAQKAREDAARVYAELGLAKEAVGAWRAVLERDPVVPEAWRSILTLYCRARQGDEAFAIASTMVALEICDEDIARVTRTLRPPFPRWPLLPKEPGAARKKIAHPLDRTPIRTILDATAARLLPHYARPLKEFGFRKKDALKEQHIPTSVLLALRTLAQLLGLHEVPTLYVGQLGAEGVAPPPFAVVPAAEPGIVVTEEVLKGGMTPERAFALGRAAAWLPPHALLAASMSAPQLRVILEALVCAFLGTSSLERAEIEVEKLAPELRRIVTLGSDADAARLKVELSPALRDYEHARAQLAAGDFQAGVGYTADRVGFLVCTDLAAAVKGIRSGAVGTPSIGARLAVKELVLFSASATYLTLRRELGLALPEAAAAPLLDLD